MGAFFTNIQVKTSGSDKSASTAQLVEVVEGYNLAAGFIKVDNYDEADKTVIISVSDSSDWISVYDEDFEDQNLVKQKRLASALSKQLLTVVLNILVSDSNFLYLGLLKKGKLTDKISNLSGNVDFSKSKQEVWSDVISNPYSFHDVKAAWEKKNLFIEGFLVELARFAQLDDSKLLTGYNYLSEERPEEGIKLHFAQKNKKPNPPLASTKFQLFSVMGLGEMKCGEQKAVEIQIHNLGESSAGLDIIVSGESVENGIVRPKNVTICYALAKVDIQNEFDGAFVETVSTTGQKIFYARFQKIYIPQGYNPVYPLTPKEARRFEKVASDSTIRFSITMTAQKVGKGKVQIFLSPLSNMDDGTCYVDYVSAIVTV